MRQKIAIVTGASSGMGVEAALALVRQGCFVVMLCRNRQRGEAAMAHIKAISGSADVALMLCDLGDMAAVRGFCAAFVAAYPRLDILINNAGILSVSRRETKDGLEAHFGVCHIGHFLLTTLLLRHMSSGARIVVVGSVAHKIGDINFTDLAMKTRYSVFRAYSRAKLCNLLFTRELSNRLKGTGITVNCVHPGFVITNIGAGKRKAGAGVRGLRKIAGGLLSPLIKTPEEGARTAVHVATSGECEGVSGAYYVNSRPAKVGKRALDGALAQRLWAVSMDITGGYGGAEPAACSGEMASGLH